MIVYECRIDKSHNKKVFKGGRPGVPPLCCGIGMRKLRSKYADQTLASPSMSAPTTSAQYY